MQSTIIRLACLLALVIAPVVLAEDLFYVGEADDQDAPRAYTLFSTADDSAFLGVTMEEEIEHDEGGARITSVVDDSPAAKAGLEEGDIVVDFGGDTVRGPVSLTKKIRDQEPGDSVRITVLRDGRRETFDVELGERSMQWGSAYGVAPGVLRQLENIQVPNVDLGDLAERLEGLNLQHLEGLEHLNELEGMNFNFDFKNLEDLQGQFWDDFSYKCEDGECLYNNMFFSSKPRLGVQLTDTTPELREHLGGSRDAGVLVGKVIDDSAAEEAGVEVGDLIVAVGDDEIGSTNDLRNALAERDGETFDIEVVRGGRSISLSVTLEEEDEDEERPSGPRALYRTSPRLAVPAAPVAIAATRVMVASAPVALAVAPTPVTVPLPEAVPAPPEMPAPRVVPVLAPPPRPSNEVI